MLPSKNKEMKNEMSEYIIETRGLGFTYTDSDEDNLPEGVEIPALSDVSLKIKI